MKEIIAENATGRKYFYPEFYENIRPCILKSTRKKTEEELKEFYFKAFEYPYLQPFQQFHQNYLDWKTHEILSLQINRGETQVFYSNGNGRYQQMLILSKKFYIRKDSTHFDLQLQLTVAFKNDPSKIYKLNTQPQKELTDISIECKNPGGKIQNFVRVGDADSSISFAEIIRRNWSGEFVYSLQKREGEENYRFDRNDNPNYKNPQFSIIYGDQPKIIYRHNTIETALKLVKGSWDTRNWIVSFPEDPKVEYKINLGYFFEGSWALYLIYPNGNEEIFLKQD